MGELPFSKFFGKNFWDLFFPKFLGKNYWDLNPPKNLANIFGEDFFLLAKPNFREEVRFWITKDLIIQALDKICVIYLSTWSMVILLSNNQKKLYLKIFLMPWKFKYIWIFQFFDPDFLQEIGLKKFSSSLQTLSFVHLIWKIHFHCFGKTNT